MSKGLIAVDVDLTVVEMAQPWLDWLNGVCDDHITMHMLSKVYGDIPYALNQVAPFCSKLEGLHTSGMDFWRNQYLYDDKKPIEGSVEVLSKLNQEGYDICFVSAITGNHQSSKYHFLKRYFPFLKGVVLTREKFLVNCDYIIDDRINILNAMPEKTKCIQYKTPFSQAEDKARDVLVLDQWGSLPELLKSL